MSRVATAVMYLRNGRKLAVMMGRELYRKYIEVMYIHAFKSLVAVSGGTNDTTVNYNYRMYLHNTKGVASFLLGRKCCFIL